VAIDLVPFALNMKERILMRRSAFVMSLAALGATTRISRADDLPTVKVIGPPNDGYKAVYYAQKAGLFRKRGIAVEIQTIGSGTAAAAALAGGAADVAFTNIAAVILGHAKGLPMEILVPAAWYLNTASLNALLVLKDSPIQTARDLNGKTVGSVSLGDLTAISIQAWMDKMGGDSKTVKLVEVPAATAVAALEQNRVAAASLNEPAVAQALSTGKVRVLAHPQDAVAVRYEAAGYAVMAPAAEKRPDVMRAFAEAVHEAELYTNSHLAQTIPIVAEYTGLAPDVIEHSVRMTDPEYVEERNLQPVIDVLVRYGLLDRGFPAKDIVSRFALAPSKARRP
jgi:NitT/TauT family transport system substrate-binding protein